MCIRDSCEINSYFHYLLTDIILKTIEQSFYNIKYILITNADNQYSNTFLPDVINEFNQSSSHLVFSKWIAKGYKRKETICKLGKVDLGGFVLDLNFMRGKNLTFLGSLPVNPTAKNYHDADGHFIEKVCSIHSIRISRINKIIYYHE